MTTTKVMVLESDKQVASSLYRRLQRVGYHVCALLASGDDALRHGMESRPDVVLTNVGLAGERDGIATASLLQEHLALPVIYLTGSTDLALFHRAMETAPYGYLYYPCDVRQIIMTIETALARHTRTQQAQQVQAQALLLTATLQAMETPVITTDTQGQVTRLNPAAEALTGWHQDEAVGQPVAAVFQVMPQTPQTPQTPFEHPALQALREGGAVHTPLDALLVTKAGTILPVESYAVPIAVPQQSPLGVVIVGRDLTAQQHLEAQRLQVRTAQTVDTLTAGVAHHFNNMLNGILGFTELALDGMSPRDPVWGCLQHVLTAGRRASDLVYQMLVFSRQQRMERYPMNPAMFLHDAITALRASQSDAVTIQEDLDLGAGMVLGDGAQLHEVLKHLCSNALHAMRVTGGVLQIRLSRVEVDAEFAAAHPTLQPGSYLRLAVSDTGEGISPEVQTHMFEPFFTTKDVGEGTGMGLAVVHGIVTHHGGVVLVESTLGKGTTISVYLPRFTEPTVPHVV